MTTFTQTLVQTFKVVSCYTCGNPFGITSEIYTRVVTDAVGSVFCPACGSKTCWRESEATKQIRQLEAKLKWEADEVARQKAARDREKSARESVEASLRTTKGVITKLKKRVSGGVCPCCNRTFQSLAKHMATKHPGYAEPVPPTE